MIAIEYALKRAHHKTNKAVSFRAATCPMELIKQIKNACAKLEEEGYIFHNVSFSVVECDFSEDYTNITVIGARMETQEECNKRIQGQERRNARELAEKKQTLYAKRMRAEFNRLTKDMTLEQLQAMSKLQE